MQLPKKVFVSLLLVEIFVCFSGMAVPFFSNDPALYAAISKRMALTNDYWNLYVYGIDWLDKPHFPFWMAAFSFELFGVSEWSYRLPALLFVLLGAFYTYLLAKKLYNIYVAQIAVLVLLSAQHLLMSNTDVRAEPYLLALIIGSVYHFYNLFQRFSLIDLFLGALMAGCAAMTKGIYGLVPVATAIAGHAFFSKQFRQLFRWRWVLAILFTAAFILPEVYAVYIQFDKHPQKVVFGKTGVSGIKWFLWDSQFSRFVNAGPITRKTGDPFYYIHTLLWAFAPWCLLFYYVLVRNIISLFKKRKLEEYISLSAIIPMLLLFSFSKFQLNFYTNILFPFFSILTASFISSGFSAAERKFYTISQIFYSTVLIACFILVNILFEPKLQWLYFIGVSMVMALIVLIIRSKWTVHLKWLVISCLAVLYINFYLNCTLYPMMGFYKGEREAAKYVNEHHPNEKLGVFYNTRNGFEFYSNQPVRQINIHNWMNGVEKERLFYADENIYKELIEKNASFTVIKEFADISSEALSLYFIKSSTRANSLHKAYLIRR